MPHLDGVAREVQFLEAVLQFEEGLGGEHLQLVVHQPQVFDAVDVIKFF